MSEAVRIEDYPFSSNHIIKLCTFQEILTRAGVDEGDLSKCVANLTTCNNFDDVFKLVEDGNFNRLVALTILYIMQRRDDRSIKIMIQNYPDDLVKLELAQERRNEEFRNLMLFRDIIREALTLEGTGMDKQRKRRILDRENPDDEIDNTVEVESRNLEIISLMDQKNDNRAFDRKTAEIISSLQNKDGRVH